jgi:hypothetical protein
MSEGRAIQNSEPAAHLCRDLNPDIFPIEGKSEPSSPENPREATLRKENRQLKRVLAEKTLEVDFFKGALQKIEARRQKSGDSGARASTTRSGE